MQAYYKPGPVLVVKDPRMSKIWSLPPRSSESSPRERHGNTSFHCITMWQSEHQGRTQEEATFPGLQGLFPENVIFFFFLT